MLISSNYSTSASCPQLSTMHTYTHLHAILLLRGSLACQYNGLGVCARQPRNCPHGKAVIAVDAVAAAAAGMPGGAVWAFDFDGVVCDSVGESSLSAWRAAEAKAGHLTCCDMTNWT